MNVRVLAATVVLAAGGSVLLTAPALAGGADVAHGDDVVRYDTFAFPTSATAKVHSTSTPGGRTTVTLTVTGLRPGVTYGAHAHTGECGTAGAHAGPHWQLVADPVKPSVDPAYANPQNEVWLDVTTDETGAGTAVARQEFAFPPAGRPRSVIIHAEATKTGPGVAGTAGPRLACVPVGF